MGKLDGRFAIVTGAGKGIGKAIAERLLQDGAAGVALFEYNEELAQATAAELARQFKTENEDLAAEDRQVLAVHCDVSDRASVEAAVQTVLDKFGRIDILVNNAGITRDHIFHKLSYEDWDKVLDTNLGGIFNTCHVVVPHMRDQGYGRIVNISSTSAYGNPGQTNYAASKAGILGFTATLAKEVARKGVVANVVTPGCINTDMYLAVPDDIRERTIRGIPMQRLGEPEEVAAVVSFLCGPDVSFTTGQVISVSGGLRTF